MSLFTIITVVYNGEECLEKTIKSLVGQSFKNYEFIIIDGKSSDNTLHVVDKYINYVDTLISEPDGGLYDAMNKGIDNASGSYLIFMNCGDCFFDKLVLERLAKSIRLNGYPDFIYGDSSEKSNGDLLIKRSRSHKYAWYGMFTHHQSMMYKRSLLADLRYNFSYPIGADYDFTLTFLNNSKTLLYFPYPVCIFERGGISSQNIKQSALDLYRIRKSKLGFNSLTSVGVLLLGLSVLAFRKLIPRLYDALRFRSN